MATARLALLALLCLCAPIWAAVPLTLDQALATADEPTPELRLAEARRAQAGAGVQAAGLPLGTRLEGRARARWIEPPDAFAYLGREDHALQLALSKTLTDFGATRWAKARAGALDEAARWQWMGARQARRYAILDRFLEVVLADLDYAYRNEAMSIAYVRFDRLRDRARLGQRSELDLRAAEVRYLETRQAVYAAQARQRASRARLALAMNRPGDLPEAVLPPDPRALLRPIPEWETIQARLEEGNPRLLAAHARVAAARAALARVGARPTLALEAVSGAYSRSSPGNGPWQAGLTLTWPLLTGGAVGVERDRARTELAVAEAELEAVRREEEQAALEDWLALEALRAAWDEVDARLAYRELYLDRARLRYEQEVESDLGDAMVELTAAQLDRHRVAYDYARAHARLLARTGRLLEARWP